MTVYIDINTGNAQRADGSPLPFFRFFQGDLKPINIVFVDGDTVVTSTTLEEGSAGLRIGIKVMGATGTLLAGVSSYDFASETASAILPLDTAEIATYLGLDVPTQQRSAQVLFEIEVTSSDGSTRQTFHQSVAALFREVIAADDTNPGAAPPGSAITDNEGNEITDNSGNAITSN